MSNMVDATAYLIVEGKRSRWTPQDVTEAKIARITQAKPATLHADQVAIKVTIRMPAKAFDALQPEAIIVVPDELVQVPVEVEAIEP